MTNWRHPNYWEVVIYTAIVGFFVIMALKVFPAILAWRLWGFSLFGSGPT